MNILVPSIVNENPVTVHITDDASTESFSQLLGVKEERWDELNEILSNSMAIAAKKYEETYFLNGTKIAVKSCKDLQEVLCICILLGMANQRVSNPM